MKCAVAIGVMLAVSIPVLGQQGQRPSLGMGVSILTDTEGVDFTPYLITLLRELKDNWIRELRHNGKEPTGKSGIVFTRFQIKPDGTVRASDPFLERTSGDATLDDAAKAAVRASTPFKPLPAPFHGPYLELRIEFIALPDEGIDDCKNCRIGSRSIAEYRATGNTTTLFPSTVSMLHQDR